MRLFSEPVIYLAGASDTPVLAVNGSGIDAPRTYCPWNTLHIKQPIHTIPSTTTPTNA